MWTFSIHGRSIIRIDVVLYTFFLLQELIEKVIVKLVFATVGALQPENGGRDS